MPLHRNRVSLEVARAQSFRDPQPKAQRLIRAFALLDGPSLSLASVTAVLELPQSRVLEILAAMSTTGWGSTTEDRFKIATGARVPFAKLVPAIPSAEIDHVLARVAAVITHAHKTTNGIPPALRADAVSAIRAAHQHHRIPIATTVARTAWRSPTAREDLDWSREIAHHGEQTAITARQPELLIELLNCSAETYFAAAEWPAAERAWLRALAVVEDLNDTTRSVHFLHLLTTNYRNWERPHKALDMLFEIMEIHERADDPIKTAQTKAEVAHIMANAGRPEAAIDYLGRADRLLRTHPPIDRAVTILHATILSNLGQIHAQLGGINAARTCYHRALALAIDTDGQTADLIRALQAALPAK